MISKFFIEHPIFASVISIVIVLAGAVAVGVLPVAQRIGSPEADGRLADAVDLPEYVARYVDERNG